jgi:hypothetical protein
MIKTKNRLGSYGFGHIELIILLFTAICLIGVGHYVIDHLKSHSSNSYTSLATISSEGVAFSEEACITNQTDKAPNQIDTVLAQISSNVEAGPKTEVVSNGQDSGGYNPLAYYSLNGGAPVTFDDWITSIPSTISFDLPPMPQTSSFNLGIEPSSLVMSGGSNVVVSSLRLCSPAAKVATLSPITTSTSKSTGSTTTSSAQPNITTSTSTTPSTTPTPISSGSTSTTTTPTQTTTKRTTSSSTPVSTTTTSTQTITPPPTVSFNASPTSITVGSASTLSWSSTNATSCSASGSWSGSKATSGSISTGNLSSSSAYTIDCIGGGGNISVSLTITVTPVPTCATTPPSSSSSSLYPLQQVVSFTGSSLPSQWADYGNEVQAPGGYVAADHAVFIPGTGLELKGYTDSISGSVKGVTGASGDVGINVASSGGFDVCITMTSGNWQDTQLVIISWPSDNNWDEGENDIFDGGGTGGPAYIYVHNIGSDPANNAYIGTWPNSVLTGTHIIGARWDPVNGYRYYLDGTLVATASIGGNVVAPTTAHHFAIQLQDLGEDSTTSETATMYWVASYGYN